MSSSDNMKTDPLLIMSTKSFLGDQVSKLDVDGSLAKDWERFYSAYNQILRRFAVSCGMQQFDVDECVQDVWLAVLEHIRDFTPDSERARFRTWLYRIVRNKAADIVRKRLKHSSLSLNDSRVEFNLESSVPPPEFEFETTWRYELIREVIEDLKDHVSERDYKIFVLRTMKKKPAAVVAKACDISEGAVRVADHRARAKLNELLKVLTDGELVPKFATDEKK